MAIESSPGRETEDRARLSPSGQKPALRWWLWGTAVMLLAAGGFASREWSQRRNRPEARFAAGLAAVNAGERAQALRVSRELVATPGWEPQGHLLAGMLLARSGNHSDAILELRHAALTESTSVAALTEMAGCYYRAGRYVDATQAAGDALARDKNAIDARRWLAAAWYDLGALGEAAGELEQIALADPADARPHRLLGLINKDRERFAQAIDHYREALRRDPQPADAHDLYLELAEAQVRLSRFDDALESLAHCEQTAAVHTLAAEALSGKGEAAAAHARLDQALAADAGSLAALVLRGTIFLSQGNVAEAIAALERAVEGHPYDSRAHFLLSQALTRAGRDADAAAQLALMEQTRKVEREFFDLHDQARQDPYDADVRHRLGELALELGKPRLAAVWFRAALAANPDHARAMTALKALAEEESTAPEPR